VSFKKTNGWSYIFYPIIDTGSPVTLLPKRVWQEISVFEVLSELVPLQGIGEGAIMARLAKIELALLGTRKEIVELTIKAYLAENDSVPLLFGIEDIITDARLVCDYPKSKAFLQI
jgi:hypothetical protein